MILINSKIIENNTVESFTYKFYLKMATKFYSYLNELWKKIQIQKVLN